MSIFVRLLASIALSSYAVLAPANADVILMPVPVFGTPPAGVVHWLRIIWGGAMNHPIVPVYFITENRTAPEGSITRYVTMKPYEFRALLRFTHSFKCSLSNVGSKPPYPPTIEVQEFSAPKVRDICVLPNDGGCQYLFGLARLPSIDWSHKDTWPLYQFEAELGCKGPLTNAHDANGKE